MSAPTLTPKPCHQGLDGDKRQYMPYVLEWKCAGCGVDCKIDFTDDYLSYPDLTGKKPYIFSGYCGECDHETPIALKLSLSMELAK